MKQLLIVAHAPSENTRRMAEAVLKGAQSEEVAGVVSCWKTPFETEPEDLIGCDAVILGTTENLGYMSGALKDFFDRCYYPVLEQKQGLPCALFVRAGHDGTGTCCAVESICSGLRWNWIQQPLVCRGEWQESFIEQCQELGMTVSARLEMGVY